MSAFSYKDVDYSKSLVISPDGVLFRTPFAALEDPTGKLVADSFGLSLVDAPLEASGLGSANRTNSALSSRLLAFANPTPPRDAIGRGATFLLDADKEVGRIAALWPPGAADVFSHDKATPDRLFAMAKDAGILHIASHAELAYNPATLSQNPAELDPLAQTRFAPNMTDASLARSMLVFAPDRDGGGYISALEAAGLDLSHAQLAVLSACDTGGVDWEKGEGIYGLRRAFISAGAEAVGKHAVAGR